MSEHQGFWDFLGALYHRYFDEGCSSLAASLAYSTLLSLVPLLMVSFFILSYFPVFQGVGQSLQKFIVSNFLAGSATSIAQHLEDFLGQMRILTWTNITALFFVSVLMIYNMVRSFNRIWHVQMKRHFAFSFLIYLIVLLTLPIIFGCLVLVNSYLASVTLLSGKYVMWVKLPIVKLFPYGVAFVIFSIFNWILPSTKVPIKFALLSGLITAILFEVAKGLFGLYFLYFPTYRLIYGALSIIPVFLIWLYVSWMLILFGALICNELTQRYCR